ncbi:hypothetical protein HAX54_028262 [Datura stramonium]|uniref:Uncharacterized protein n=1 Tax=Datura stramonium TaxID=4076 RepID=A0ABS8V611_DATST|nr:hypothetical protein [Datura stramonium]
MSTSRRNSKGKALVVHTATQNLSSDEAQHIAHIRFGLARMEEYYVSFKEKRSIHAETQFEVKSFRNDFPDIYYQIDMRNWGPSTIPVDPYFSELVWEFYASYKVPIEVAILVSCVMDHTYINVGEIIADQFKRKAKRQATPLLYPNIMSMLYLCASCPLFWPLDKTMKAEGVITLDTRTNKDALASKRPKGIGDMINPPPSMFSSTTIGSSQPTAVTASPPNDLLKIAQMAQAHES